MEARRVSALFLVAVMALAGCLGATEPAPDIEEEAPDSYELKTTWIVAPTTVQLGEEASFTLGIQQIGQGEWTVGYEVLRPDFSPVEDVQWVENDVGLELAFTPTLTGEHVISITIVNAGTSTLTPPVESMVLSLTVTPPDEPAPILTTPSRLVLEEPNVVWFEGSVDHPFLDSCTVSYTISDGNDGSIALNADGAWKILVDFTEATESHTITTLANCGRFATASDTSATQVIIEGAGDDQDGDGVQDANDRCPTGIGADDGWQSTTATDGDQDGCRDNDEDEDDDNDGIVDTYDLCPESYGWVSTPSADYDYDGCHDADEDNDDDNDGVMDVDDLCPVGRKGWFSNRYSDWDNDGCSDLDEDDNDDNDDHDDTTDMCAKGVADWVSDSDSDWDNDGCQDATEDDDDDNDGVNDLNATGAVLDLCPKTPINATDVNDVGCAAVERDSDADGVNDFVDQCEGTPTGLDVNDVGCADIDGDGVFANVDQCPQSPDRWTVDAVGCAVVQNPIAWTSASSLDGPMQVVPQFTFPTLNGTFNFNNRWTGHDVYFFMFKYTDANGNSNAATWGQNPGKFIRNLPLNTHLFYGSFDNSYHNDVIQQRNAVLAGLTTSEEAHWDDRIHYIDIDASNLGGGIGSMIGSFNNPFFMGIDRFQLARETGSLYAWTTQSNDPYHLSFEPNQWVAEFPTKVRELDPAVHAVTVMDFQRHTGGWGGGYSSFTNATFDLPNDLSTYDTLEVYHEHACYERTNRYQKSDGTYGGCHEWDYLAYLFICDRDNDSICNTESVRWITTYGREGMWLTDISPYLFMLNDGEERRFKYAGANKGDLTVTFLFSNWGSGTRAVNATYAFSGGQFDGTYNDETKYTRQLNFTVPPQATSVEIVATITGHGFNQDNANCAEFCDHQHHYTMGQHTTYEWHPIVYSREGCENEVNNGVVANQFGSWPFGRAGWCAGQDVKQWRYDITDWVDNSTNNTNHMEYRGLYNGQEYTPSDGIGNGGRNIRAVVWIVFYGPTT
ncbi:MAG: hypothetical protein CL980_05220 [Euryarchaeota archaeon]|nr:hypothetical protein [Euryarchaeota archaeon]